MHTLSPPISFMPKWFHSKEWGWNIRYHSYRSRCLFPPSMYSFLNHIFMGSTKKAGARGQKKASTDPKSLSIPTLPIHSGSLTARLSTALAYCSGSRRVTWSRGGSTAPPVLISLWKLLFASGPILFSFLRIRFILMQFLITALRSLWTLGPILVRSVFFPATPTHSFFQV